MLSLWFNFFGTNNSKFIKNWLVPVTLKTLFPPLAFSNLIFPISSLSGPILYSRSPFSGTRSSGLVTTLPPLVSLASAGPFPSAGASTVIITGWSSVSSSAAVVNLLYALRSASFPSAKSFGRKPPGAVLSMSSSVSSLARWSLTCSYACVKRFHALFVTSPWAWPYLSLMALESSPANQVFNAVYCSV